MHKRRQGLDEPIAEQEIGSREEVTRTTCSGQKINKPSQFLSVNNPEGYFLNGEKL